MAISSIRFKVCADKEIKEKLINTHRIFNEYVARFEEFLLLIQGKDYYYLDEFEEEHYVSQEEADERLNDFIQKLPGKPNADKCKKAFEALIKVIGEKKSQAAGSLAALYMANSTAGQNNIKKIVNPQPEWMLHYDAKNKEFSEIKYQKEAEAWIKSVQGQNAIKPLLEGSGAPSAFKRAYLGGKPWVEAFVKDQIKFRNELEGGLAFSMKTLDDMGLLPLLHFPKEILQHPVWLKLMLKTALDNFASYLETDKSTREDYANCVLKFEKAEIASQPFEAEKAQMESYFSDQYAETVDRSMCLTKRMVRGVETVFAIWKRCTNEAERISVIDDFQADKNKAKQLGDVNFLKWLAEESNTNCRNMDCMRTLIVYYDCKAKKERKKKCNRYTVANAISSKRFVKYDNPKGSNYKKYKLMADAERLYVGLPVLVTSLNGEILEEQINFSLAKNNQFLPPEEKAGYNSIVLSETHVTFANSKRYWDNCSEKYAREVFSGEIREAALMPLGNLTKNRDIFISIPIEINPLCEPSFQKISDEAKLYFSSAYSPTGNKHMEYIDNKQIRALAIDLGLKQFGACAVGKKLFKADHCEDVSFEIERRFMLRLPGEGHDNKTDENRRLMLSKLNDIKRDINYLRTLKWLYGQADISRRHNRIDQALKFVNRQDVERVYKELRNEADIQNMNLLLSMEYDKMMQSMNKTMQGFRGNNSAGKQRRNYNPGKSFWAIEYLETVRKLIISWNSLGYRIDEENKTMSRGYGVTATHLLEHINNLKDDRIKTGADLLVQAARGYVYDEDGKCWIQKYPCCNVIVFEDLSRYDFKTERTRAENSMLMKWSHREIVKETINQAGLYGITVYDSTDSALTSKYLHSTDTPGIRCDRVKKADFDANGSLKETVLEKLPDIFHNKLDCIKVGSIIPSPIGSLFVTLNQDSALHIVNADMNAAENLLGRFFGSHTHLLKLNVECKEGKILLKGDEEQGKRLKGQLIYHFGTLNLNIIYDKTTDSFVVTENKKNTGDIYEKDGKLYAVYNDPSGVLFDSEKWYDYATFWNGVKNAIEEKVCEIL